MLEGGAMYDHFSTLDSVAYVIQRLHVAKDCFDLRPFGLQRPQPFLRDVKGAHGVPIAQKPSNDFRADGACCARNQDHLRLAFGISPLALTCLSVLTAASNLSVNVP